MPARRLDSRDEAQIAALAGILASDDHTGEILRALAGRLRHPDEPHTDKELEALLTVTLALERAGMWP